MLNDFNKVMEVTAEIAKQFEADIQSEIDEWSLVTDIDLSPLVNINSCPDRKERVNKILIVWGRLQMTKSKTMPRKIARDLLAALRGNQEESKPRRRKARELNDAGRVLLKIFEAVWQEKGFKITEVLRQLATEGCSSVAIQGQWYRFVKIWESDAEYGCLFSDINSKNRLLSKKGLRLFAYGYSPAVALRILNGGEPPKLTVDDCEDGVKWPNFGSKRSSSVALRQLAEKVVND